MIYIHTTDMENVQNIFPTDRQYFVNDPGINLQTIAALSISANIFCQIFLRWLCSVNIPKDYAATLK